METGRRKTIGVFIDWIESSYHLELISSIEKFTSDLDINIITFVGGALHSPQKFEILCNTIYDFINKKNIDGILMANGSLGRYCTSDYLIEFSKKFAPIPVISISQSLPGITSVISDNTTGLKDMIIHLINNHGYKKIGFIKGIEGNQDAEQRFFIYKQTLEECNIPFNKTYIMPGDFSAHAGEKAVHLYLERNILPEALIAANDDMAIGAIEALKSRGIVVPFDIAVVGFDDQPASKSHTPPLTTVRQNIGKQAIKAVQLMIDTLNNIKTEPVQIIPTEVVIRQSCGCGTNTLVKLQTLLPDKNYSLLQNKPDTIANKKEEVLSQLQDDVRDKILRINITPDDIAELFYELCHNMDHPGDDSFTALLHKMINKSLAGPVTRSEWVNIIFTMVTRTAAYVYQKETLLSIENIFFQAQSIITSRLPEAHTGHISTDINEQVKIFSNFTEGIVGTVDIKSLMKLIDLAAPRMEIERCYFSIFNQKSTSQSKSILIYDRNLKQGPAVLGNIFPSEDLLPDRQVLNNNQYNLRVHPFLRDGVFLGFTVFEFQPSHSMIQHLLRKMFLAEILKGVYIYESIRTESNRLEALVNERTRDLKQTEIRLKEVNMALEKEKQTTIKANEDLKTTLKELKQMQKELVEAEKMAALGNLVAGIAHEINTPIGIGVTAASHLENETKLIYSDFFNKQLTRSILHQYLETVLEASTMIMSNLKRGHELIRSFKDIAVDQSSETVRVFNIKDYIQDVLLSLRPRLKKVKHTISIDCPDDLSITSFPGVFSQIITNLIMNSLSHGYKNDESGLIEIKIKQIDDTLYFVYTDDGKGIAKEHLLKIFNPFFTTSRGDGGTGLGLHLVYNIVKRKLGGTITCNSKKGEGVCFIITFPINPPLKNDKID